MDKSLFQTFGAFDLVHTCELRLFCYVGNTAQQCRLGFFKILILQETLKTQNQHQVVCIFGSQTFVPRSWMCKKQSSVSHSSTQADLISFDAGLRMDGIPALDLWDLVIEVFHSSPNQSKKTIDQARGDSPRNTTSNKHTPDQTKVPTKHNNLELSEVDYVSSNPKSSLFGAMFYIFEDNEAVIKMIIKGRSPTMRHVSRTRRVALDWLFDIINLDPQIQTRYIDTKQQLADMLTKSTFTRDEWNNLQHLFNISHFSSTCCGKNSSFISCTNKMANRVQEQKKEERIVAKSRLTAMNLSLSVAASSSSAKNPITSSNPGKLMAAGKTASRTRRNSKPDEAPSSQVKLKDVYLGGLMGESGETCRNRGESSIVGIL